MAGDVVLRLATVSAAKEGIMKRIKRLNRIQPEEVDCEYHMLVGSINELFVLGLIDGREWVQICGDAAEAKACVEYREANEAVREWEDL